MSELNKDILSVVSIEFVEEIKTAVQEVFGRQIKIWFEKFQSLEPEIREKGFEEYAKDMEVMYHPGKDGQQEYMTSLMAMRLYRGDYSSEVPLVRRERRFKILAKRIFKKHYRAEYDSWYKLICDAKIELYFESMLENISSDLTRTYYDKFRALDREERLRSTPQSEIENFERKEKIIDIIEVLWPSKKDYQ